MALSTLNQHGATANNGAMAAPTGMEAVGCLRKWEGERERGSTCEGRILRPGDEAATELTMRGKRGRRWRHDDGAAHSEAAAMGKGQGAWAKGRGEGARGGGTVRGTARGHGDAAGMRRQEGARGGGRSDLGMNRSPNPAKSLSSRGTLPCASPLPCA